MSNQGKECESGSKRNNCKDIKTLFKQQKMLMKMATNQQAMLGTMAEKLELGAKSKGSEWTPNSAHRTRGGRRRTRRRKKRTRKRRKSRRKKRRKSRRKKRR